MKIGIPKEVKDHEYRVGATPAVVKMLVKAGHTVVVETLAGDRIGYADELYREAGATIVASAAEAYDVEMVIKVKEPQPSEYAYLKEGQILFTFLHLAPDPEQTKALLEAKVVGIAYETVTDAEGRLPLLEPMSEIAGRVAVQAGAHCLEMVNGGRGVLLGGVAGVLPARVTVIGAGTVGTEAARMAMGLGAQVLMLDVNLKRLRQLDALFAPRIRTLYSQPDSLYEAVVTSDLVIGAVLLPGKKAPHLVTREMVQHMPKGSVIVDVAIDQGGCCETSRPTTHSQPTYVEEGVVHYCVTNMPGACARTSTQALTNATMTAALSIANKGYRQALFDSPHLRAGLNVCLGSVTNESVAEDLGYEFVPPEHFL